MMPAPTRGSVAGMGARDIIDIAQAVIERFGDRATPVLRDRVALYFSYGDVDAGRMWEQVEVVATELLRVKQRQS